MAGMLCQDCGQSTDRDAEFCSHCGAFLEWTAVDGDRDASPVAVAPAPVGDAASAGATASETTSPTGAPAGATAVRAPLSPGAGAARQAGGCRRCGTDNPPGRRFCRKCALEFDPPATAGWTSRTRRPRPPWWRRWLGGHRTPAERRALRAYRRSLPVRHRVFRALAALLVVGLVAAAVWAVRGNPVRWAQARWYDYHDTVQPVGAIDAAVDASDPQLPAGSDPASAVDGDSGTAWTTAWTTDGTAGAAPASCSGEWRTAQRLLLTFRDGVADVRGLRIEAGLAGKDERRLTQHRPKVLELRSSDGTCQPIALDDDPSEQTVMLSEPVSTDVLLIDIVDVHAAQADNTDLVSITEFVPLQRPPH